MSSSSTRTLRQRKPKEPIGDPTPVKLSGESSKKTPRSASTKRKSEKKESPQTKRPKRNVIDTECRFVGEPIPDSEARNRWPARYDPTLKKATNGDDEEEILIARCHYTQCEVDGFIFSLDDDAYVKSGVDTPDYIGKIVEFFETIDNRPFFTAQWFYKAEDTVIQDHSGLVDSRRVFLSAHKNENPLDCIVSKLKIVKVNPNIDPVAKEATIRNCDFYYDMSYSLAYSTFANISSEIPNSDSSSTISIDAGFDNERSQTKSNVVQTSFDEKLEKPTMTLLDLYSGCGAMSTGLCMGASTSGVNLVTRWAVDINEHACQSLQYNHPETQVRNESADNFLIVLKEWAKLCKKFHLLGTKRSETKRTYANMKNDMDEGDNSKVPAGEFEVAKFIGICFGDPNNLGKSEIHLKVCWKGFGPVHDTWEPMSGLGKCQEKLKEFVTEGYQSILLPLPGDVDVICGGPPCQGISGFNRFRNKEKPLDDPKNKQLVVYMDLVEYLKPKFVLMENVVDILKFAKGFLGRYAIGRLVAMNYQTRLGMMVAGCYGLPQFRMRVFLWGALPTEKLPQYPLPTHDVVVRGGIPAEFEGNTVAYDETQVCQREKKLLLGDAISDLPAVANDETRDEMPYTNAPQTDFQRFIRSSKEELMGCNDSSKKSKKGMLLDHRPLQLNVDDYQRVCQIPKKKGANFRDLPGIVQLPDKRVLLDKDVERILLPSGKPLIPDYAITFQDGFSFKPFGRLWWDETVPTVVTRAEPHNQVVTHPTQDRVLSVRENARLQGFPDYYKLFGPIKARYTQVGNAVAVPVARVLGYALGLAAKGIATDEPLITLPSKFSNFGVSPSSDTDGVRSEETV